MFLTLRKLTALFPRLNQHPLSLCDFETVAEAQHITLLEIRLKRRGYCLFDLIGKDSYIFLRKGLDELKFLETLYHEFGHVCGLNEHEAAALSLMAVLPLPLMQNYDFLEEYPTKYARKIWNEREKVYFLYGV